MTLFATLLLIYAIVVTIYAILVTTLYLAWRWAAKIRLDDAEYWKREATAMRYNKETCQ